MSQNPHDGTANGSDDSKNVRSDGEEKKPAAGELTIAVDGDVEQNAVSKFFGSLLTAAKERVLGDTWWLPSDPTEIVEIPAKYLAANHSKCESYDDLMLLKGTYSASTVYHVSIVWRKDGKTYSLWRNNLLAASKDFMRSVAPFVGLLKYIESVKDVKALLTYIGKHPLWKLVHIAARMCLLGYFDDAHVNGSLPALLSQACQPEGRYPIHLAVFYGHVDLTKKLFSYGASVAQTDTKGQTALHYGARTSPTMLEVLCAHPEAKKCMNAWNSDGYTPLFLAISSCSPTCVAALMQRGAVLNITCQGRSALHEAMLQNNDKVKEVVQTIVDGCPGAATEADPLTGNSLIHMATNKKSLAALVAVNPDMDRNVKNKAGQTALHWHVQRDDLGMVISLTTLGVDLNAQDNDGNCALHLAVSRGNLDIVKALLVLGGDVHVDNSSGDTAFHLATRLNHKDKYEIMRCLIVCGAKPCQPNKRGCTAQCAYRTPGQPPRPPPPYSTLTDVIPLSASADVNKPTESAAGLIASFSDPTLPLKAKEPPKNLADTRRGSSPKGNTGTTDLPIHCTHVMSEIDKYMHRKSVARVTELCKQKSENAHDRRRPEVVLSLDGGGIRGVVLAQLLLALERELGEPIIDYVDWLAGTSTGAFLAAGLAIGKPLRECQNMYLLFKDQIFESWVRPYSADILQKFLMSTYGAQTTMADIEKPRFIITTTAADKIPIRLHLFRNYRLPLSEEENEELGYSDPADQQLWKALRCSSAAPTYFSSYENKYVDGGLAANNPTLDTLVEIQRYNNALEYKGKSNERLEIGCLISLGTGALPDVPSESLNFGGVDSLSAVRTLGLMLVEQACATEGSPVERSRAWMQRIGSPMFRLNPRLSKEYMLDTKDDKDTIAMMWEAEEYARDNAPLLKELAEFLKMIKKG